MLLFSINLTQTKDLFMASFCGFWLVVMALWFLDALFGFLSLPLFRLPNVVLLETRPSWGHSPKG